MVSPVLPAAPAPGSPVRVIPGTALAKADTCVTFSN
jgi:hypothetical protein